MPVVIFCLDNQQCENLSKALKCQGIIAQMFIGDDASTLGALLEQFRQISQGIVLTTSIYCKGADFVFAVPQAFVIHLTLP
jgi:uncharacterized membrane protein affecting hemolysin expression